MVNERRGETGLAQGKPPSDFAGGEKIEPTAAADKGNFTMPKSISRRVVAATAGVPSVSTKAQRRKASVYPCATNGKSIACG